MKENGLKKKNRPKKSLMSRKFFSMLLGGTLTMVVASFLLMSDSLVAGAKLGNDAVAGITLTVPIYSAVNFFASIFSLGLPIIYSAKMGEFEKKEADRVFGFGVFISLVVGVLLMGFVMVAADDYLRSYGPSEKVFSAGMDYLYWMRFSFLVIPFQTLMAAMVYADGDEAIATIANLCQGLGNIIASIILCDLLGVKGIGLASFVFNMVSIGLLCIHFFREGNSLHPVLSFSFIYLTETVQYSLIDASSYLFIGIMTAVLNRFISFRFGSSYLVLISIATLYREFQLVFDGIGEAMTPLIGIYLGEGCSAGVQRIYKLAERTSFVESVLLTAFMMVAAPFVPYLLGINDPLLSAYAIRGIRILSLSSLPVCLMYLSSSYYLLAEKFLLGFIICILRDLLLAAPLAVVLGNFYGPDGIFGGLMAGPLLAYLLSALIVKLRYRDDAPLLFKTLDLGESRLFELGVDDESMVETRDEIEAYLEDKNYDHRSIMRTMLLFEELLLLIREKNGDKEVLCECLVIPEEEEILLIVRDDGEYLDYAEADSKNTSFQSYITTRLIGNMTRDRKHLTAISFNRNTFSIKALRTAK